MNIDYEINQRLRRKDGEDVIISFKQAISNKTRVQTIIDCIKDTKINGVLNIGCGYHPSRIKEQVKDNKFLYKVLTENFDSLMGIDHNEETVNVIKELGFKNIFYADLISPKSKAMASTFFEDEPFVVLLADKLEHTHNPILFLKQIIKNYGKKGNKLIISVPNAYGYQRILRMQKEGIERINEDHKYMFTPMTILKVLVMAGVIPERIEFAGYFDLNGKDVSSSLEDKLWMMGHTIIVTCSFR